MSAISELLKAHLETGHTTLCRAWHIQRRDGQAFAFTDHDLNLGFDGITFKANSGLGAKALSQTTGLSVDNSEALGALSDASIREDEIEQGRFDGAEVRCWLLNWMDVSQRWMQFRGTIGELKRANGAFTAELRGLTEALNRPVGRVYQKPCTAVLGDAQCRVDTSDAEFSVALPVQINNNGREFIWESLSGFEDGWFARGRMNVLEGAAKGLWGVIKLDRTEGNRRIIELWETIRGDAPTGTSVRLDAGCDKRFSTCRAKFNNHLNFQGFPDLPSEDWVLAVPRSTGTNTGGSLR
jgi:uncharacterized phage protein (TIGR02218 family)